MFVAMLAINYVVYKREKTLLEINEKYKRFYNRSLEECVELKSILVRTDKEKEAYRKAIEDCIENFNATYSNTKLSFDEDKLVENISSFVSLINKTKPSAVKGKYILNIAISTTMGPGIKVDANSFEN